MALEQNLSVSGVLDAQAAQTVIADATGIEVDRHGRAAGPGLTVYASASSPLHQQVIEDAYGFRPALSVTFRLDTGVGPAEVAQARRQVIRAALALLRNNDGVLLANNETTILQSIDGKLAINSDWSEWESYALTHELVQPYESRSLPSPLI